MKIYERIYERFDFGIFDCDSTLVQTGKAYVKDSNTLTTWFIGILRKLIPLPILMEVENLLIKFFDYIGKEVKYSRFPNTAFVLKFLKNLGHITLFVSSASKQKVLERKLQDSDISRYFEIILGAPKGKQHLEIIRKSLNLSIKEFSKKAFFVGDNPSKDIKLAKSYGLYAIGITNSHSAEELKKAGADAVIDEIEQLLELKL